MCAHTHCNCSHPSLIFGKVATYGFLNHTKFERRLPVKLLKSVTRSGRAAHFQIFSHIYTTYRYQRRASRSLVTTTNPTSKFKSTITAFQRTSQSCLACLPSLHLRKARPFLRIASNWLLGTSRAVSPLPATDRGLWPVHGGRRRSAAVCGAARAHKARRDCW